MTLEEARAFVTHVHDKLGRWPGFYSGHTIKRALGTAVDPSSRIAGSGLRNTDRHRSYRRAGAGGQCGNIRTAELVQRRTAWMELEPATANTTMERTLNLRAGGGNRNFASLACNPAFQSAVDRRCPSAPGPAAALALHHLVALLRRPLPSQFLHFCFFLMLGPFALAMIISRR